jgi:hypothetical protein
MRTLTLIGVLILLSPAARSEPVTSFLWPRRILSSSAFTYGNQRSFSNSRGEFVGSSITHGNTTAYFDKAGRYQGSTIRQGTPSNPLTGGR